MRHMAAALAVTALALSGCFSSKRSRVTAPSLSPSSAARQAMDQFDANKDGFVAGPELDQCPAMKLGLKNLDKNGDSKLSQDEIADRLKAYADSKIGILSVNCQVLLGGEPVAQAEVTFEPESFMGPAFRPARGVTDGDGFVQLKGDGADVEGLPLGFYKVRVSRKDPAGQEMLPAHFNVKSVLGQEVGPGQRDTIMLSLN